MCLFLSNVMSSEHAVTRLKRWIVGKEASRTGSSQTSRWMQIWRAFDEHMSGGEAPQRSRRQAWAIVEFATVGGGGGGGSNEKDLNCI